MCIWHSVHRTAGGRRDMYRLAAPGNRGRPSKTQRHRPDVDACARDPLPQPLMPPARSVFLRATAPYKVRRTSGRPSAALELGPHASPHTRTPRSRPPYLLTWASLGCAGLPRDAANSKRAATRRDHRRACAQGSPYPQASEPCPQRTSGPMSSSPSCPSTAIASTEPVPPRQRPVILTSGGAAPSEPGLGVRARLAGHERATRPRIAAPSFGVSTRRCVRTYGPGALRACHGRGVCVACLWRVCAGRAEGPGSEPCVHYDHVRACR